MTTGLPALRALVIYGVCVPLAVMLGYVLTNPTDLNSLICLGGVLGLLSIPLLLKWHHPLLVLAWNSSALVFILPGRPALWLVMSAVSLGISILQITLNRRVKFLHAPVITRPLIFLVAVTLMTAKLTGGVGFRVFGGASYGGIRYVLMLGAVMGYFALTARRIPPERAPLYCGLFLLSGIATMISSLTPHLPSAFQFLFWIWPPTSLAELQGQTGNLGETRIGGTVGLSVALLSFLLARYGLRGILLSGKPWRALALIGSLVIGLFGGFRSILILSMLIVGFQFYMEGLLKSRLLPIMILGAILGAAILMPNTSKLPRTFQRAMAFLPVEIDPEIRIETEQSTAWRIEVWKDVLPEVPKTLLLGQGYALRPGDYELTQQGAGIFGQSHQHWKAALTGDYHNGPLSVIVPFGLWGAIAFLWLLGAGCRLLYCNYRYGDPALSSFNVFLFAAFVAQIVEFFVVFGSFYLDLWKFLGMLGMSVSLNGGMCKPARASVAVKPAPIRMRPGMQPAPSLPR